MVTEARDEVSSAIFIAFSHAIHAKAQVLRRPDLSVTARSRLREAISDDLKKVSNFLTPEISEAAMEEAEELGVDLYTKTWHDQPSFDAGREIFHLEHVRPVSFLRDECCKAETAEDVRRVLTTQLRVAWILKDEDRRLSAAGFRSRRPDPDGAYRGVGITLRTRCGSGGGDHRL